MDRNGEHSVPFVAALPSDGARVVYVSIVNLLNDWLDVRVGPIDVEAGDFVLFEYRVELSVQHVLVELKLLVRRELHLFEDFLELLVEAGVVAEVFALARTPVF